MKKIYLFLVKMCVLPLTNGKSVLYYVCTNEGTKKRKDNKMEKSTAIRMIDDEMEAAEKLHKVFTDRLPIINDQEDLEWKVNASAARNQSSILITLGRLRSKLLDHDENEIKLGV